MCKQTVSAFSIQKHFSDACNIALANLFIWAKKGDRGVNIFRKYNYCITTCISTLCKTYCFAFQKRLFCTVKA